MDTKFINNNLVERYVLNQLNEDELALFRAQLMFDEELRKEVVNTKLLLGGLKTIAIENGIPQPLPPKNPRFSPLFLRASAVIGVLLIIAGLTYYWYNLDTAPVQTESEVEVPTTNDQNTSLEPKTKELKPSEEQSKPAVVSPPTNKETEQSPKAKTKKPPVFADAKKAKDKPIEIVIESNDVQLGFAQSSFSENEYLEDAIDNSISKSDSPIVNLQLNNTFKLNNNGEIAIKATGNIISNISNARYIFKFYSNDTDEYIENNPKFSHRLVTRSDKNGFAFDLNFIINLPEGLYYYVIEQEIKKDSDMIYVGKITVEE